MKEFIVRVIDPEEIQWYEEEPEIPELVRCKDCKHRPYDEEGYGISEDLVFPDDVCPFQCDDPWYSIYQPDEFFCAKGERR